MEPLHYVLVEQVGRTAGMGNEQPGNSVNERNVRCVCVCARECCVCVCVFKRASATA